MDAFHNVDEGKEGAKKRKRRRYKSFEKHFQKNAGVK